MKKILLGLGFLLFSIRVTAQNGEVLPVIFDQFFQNRSLIHPGATGSRPSWQLFSGHRAITGVFQGVYTTYAGANYRWKGRDTLSNDYHGFGINVINDREGSFFNRGRFYFSYAWHNRITENWTLSAGFTGQLIHYVYAGSDIHPGGAATKPNADIGLFLYDEKKTKIGFSIVQLFKRNFSPLEPSLYTKRHFLFSAERSFQINWMLDLDVGFLFRHPSYKGRSDVSVYLLGKIHQKFSFGAEFKYKKGLSYIVGLDEIYVGRKVFSFYLSFYTPFAFGSDIRVNIMEGTLRLGFN